MSPRPEIIDPDPTLTDVIIGVSYGPQEDDLTSVVRVAVHRTARRLRAEAQAAADLTQSQFCVLASLERTGPMTPGELAEHERVQPPSMTRTVAALEETGYVARAAHPRDRRQVLVALTDAGREVLGEVQRKRTAWLTAALHELDAPERETLREAAALLMRMVER